VKVPAQAVLITGATSGIGPAAALAFARSGANVVLIGRAAERGGRSSTAK
jgi:short-subunit dehydrogenase